MNLADLRDIVIIVYGVLGILLFVLLIGIAVATYLIVRQIHGHVIGLVNDPVRPTLEELQKTAQNVRVASEFMVDRTVHPVIRTLALVRGVRRGVSSLAGLPTRLRR
ncbi:MAG: hypothetical protein FJZ92_09350 [Chloroflexi bacterium]|nr:hypothetical protein [Chloroflexota bacterium]